MKNIGPNLHTLLHRLAETPTDFVAGPVFSATPAAAMSPPEVTAALVNDLLTRLGRPCDAEILKRFCADDASGKDNRLAIVRIVVWLLADDWLRQTPLVPDAVLHLLDLTTADLAKEAKAGQYVGDTDRREELARIVLARLGYRPQGETEAQATDRLSAISSSERRRLVAASRETERRARAIREALVRKQAEESADKWSRE